MAMVLCGCDKQVARLNWRPFPKVQNAHNEILEGATTSVFQMNIALNSLEV
jgi:hypothetical protein